MSGDDPGGDLPPLKITCKSTKCEENKHCFLPGPKRRKRKGDTQPILDLDSATASSTSEFLHPEQTGRCWRCNADLIDWGRIHKRDIADAPYTFECLDLELFRHRYWTLPLDEKAIVHARKKGFTGMQAAVEKRMRSKQIAFGVTPGAPTFDGRQTPLAGNVIFYAQHATATCCRKCMEVWHRIPRDRDLTEEEIRYIAGLNMLYIRQRLPNLTEQGERLPRQRKQQNTIAGAGEDSNHAANDH